jgi:hypothetical protein
MRAFIEWSIETSPYVRIRTVQDVPTCKWETRIIIIDPLAFARRQSA